MATVGENRSRLPAILKAIKESELTDEDLAVIGQATFKRRQSMALAASKRIEIGDPVQLTRIKPRYMEGETGVLQERMPGGKLKIKLDHPQGRFSGGTVVCHPTCVEPLDA